MKSIGIGDTAVQAIRYGFDILALNKITSRHMSENPSSGKVMQKVGMIKEGYLKQDFCKNGKFVDMVVYGFLREEFQSSGYKLRSVAAE